MKYWIQAVSTGHCMVRDYITYQDNWEETTSRFELWIWAILGGRHPMLVDTGPRDVEGFNRATSKYIPGGIVQTPEERTPAALARHGIDPAEISHVFITHMHADHYDYFDLFPDACMVVNRIEFVNSLESIAPHVMKALGERWPRSIRLVGDEEVLPGIRTLHVGCHSPGSQAIAVDTAAGTAVMAGDVVYRYENIEQDRPINSGDEPACRAALEKVRAAGDIVLPAHDPRVAERFPGGIIGSPPAGK